jgi:hypothetical protein
MRISFHDSKDPEINPKMKMQNSMQKRAFMHWEIKKTFK